MWHLGGIEVDCLRDSSGTRLETLSGCRALRGTGGGGSANVIRKYGVKPYVSEVLCLTMLLDIKCFTVVNCSIAITSLREEKAGLVIVVLPGHFV